jgi:polyhydroxyalkanoate synthesis regulator phasin
MSETLALTCLGNNRRPAKSIAMRQEAATKLVDQMIKGGHIEKDDQGISIANIVEATRYETDGYKIARELENRHHWDCDMVIAEQMDRFSGILEGVYDIAEKQWAAENPSEPTFLEGESVIWRGKPAVVRGTCEYRPQCYRLQNDEIKAGSSAAFIVPFEDVSAHP